MKYILGENIIGQNNYHSVFKQNISFSLLLAIIFLQAVFLNFVYNNYYPEISPYNRYAGFILTLVCVAAFRRKLVLPTEYIILLIYWLWAIISGLFVVENEFNYWTIVKTNVQGLILNFSIIIITIQRKDMDVVLIPFIISSLFILIYGYSTGDFSLDKIAFLSGRKSSLFDNPNSTGAYLLITIISLFYFLGRASLFYQIFLIILIILCSLALIFTGSRTPFIGLVVFLFSWSWFTFRPKERFKISNIIILSVFTILTYNFIRFVWQETFLGERLQSTVENPDLDTDRKTMYDEAWNLFKESPITGVGLGNFFNKSPSLSYSHADYPEILSTTGLVGFILYFSIYFIIIVKLYSLQRIYNTREIIYIIDYFKAIMVTIFTISFGYIVSQYILFWILLSSMVGYIYILRVNAKYLVK